MNFVHKTKKLGMGLDYIHKKFGLSISKDVASAASDTNTLFIENSDTLNTILAHFKKR